MRIESPPLRGRQRLNRVNAQRLFARLKDVPYLGDRTAHADAENEEANLTIRTALDVLGSGAVR
jgi:hypothetical protein